MNTYSSIHFDYAKRQAYLPQKAKRVVIKLGSSSVIGENGFSQKFVSALAKQIQTLRQSGQQVILVSSGAVSLGHRELNWPVPFHKLSVPERQALAAVGQGILIENYRRVFGELGIQIGQILLSAEDIHRRRSFLHLRNALETLTRNQILPIMNENDSVAIEELLFGDNDTLAANVAILAQADILFILSDVEGYYYNGQLVAWINRINKEVRDGIQSSKNAWGRGGMKTKLDAAQLLMNNGSRLVITSYHEENVVSRFFNGENIGTLFFNPESVDHLQGKRRWIALGNESKGSIGIDQGAAEQLIAKGRSLLAKGVIEVKGKFAMGDLVSIVHDGRIIGRGLIHFASKEMEKIKGAHSSEIPQILGRQTFQTVIHRNNLVLVDYREE